MLLSLTILGLLPFLASGIVAKMSCTCKEYLVIQKEGQEEILRKETLFNAQYILADSIVFFPFWK